MNYLYIKALHIIFVTTWFAGLFYIVRLFIYHIEAMEKPELERDILTRQYALMEGRLWKIITIPSMWLTVSSGLYLAYALNYFTAGWMHVKFTLVLGLIVYHVICGRIVRQLANGIVKYTSHQMRLWNEVATLFLFAIVLIVVLKSMMDTLFLLGIIVALGIILFLAIRWYKRYLAKRKLD